MSTDPNRSMRQSSDGPSIWTEIEALSDLLAEMPDLESACLASLQFGLQSIGRASGAMVVQAPRDPAPILTTRCNLSGEWAGQLDDAQSQLRHFAQQVVETGLTFAGENLPADLHSTGLAAAIPVLAKSGLQGVVLARGKPIPAAEASRLAQLMRPAGRMIHLYRSHPLVHDHVNELDALLKIANTNLQTNHWELLRSRNTLRALFDSIPAALYIVDHQYKLVAINMSCANRTGNAPKDLVGRPCHEALYGRREPCSGCRVKETLLTGQTNSRTERRWGLEEDPTEWEIHTYPIYDESEQVIQAILLEQDVTEKRRLEGIIAQSEKLAAVGQLAAGVAHEINNPLTAIIANAQIMRRELPVDSDLQESINLIARAGARATEVVRNLLDFARKEQYYMDLTDVNDTIKRSLAMVQHELLARSIRLSFEPAADTPPVMASQDHLQSVWLNMLMNAMDAIDESANPQGKIRIFTRRAGSEIRISIVDNGQGIPPERMSHIFEPFYTTKAPGRGTGLGLSVCHRIVKQHGGHIEVESQVGAGTEFTVVLPIA